MDIRRYFGGHFSNSSKGSDVSVKNNSTKNNRKRKLDPKDNGPKVKVSKTKRNVIISDSDSDEDPIPPKLQAKLKSKSAVASSDSDNDFKTTPKSNKIVTLTVKKYSPVKSSPVKNLVSVSAYFSKSPIERSERKVFAIKKLDKEIHDDKEFEATLQQIDCLESSKKIASLIQSDYSVTQKDAKQPIVKVEENHTIKTKCNNITSKNGLVSAVKDKTPEKAKFKETKSFEKGEIKSSKDLESKKDLAISRKKGILEKEQLNDLNEKSIKKETVKATKSPAKPLEFKKNSDVPIKKESPGKSEFDVDPVDSLNSSFKSEKKASKGKNLDTSFTEKKEKSDDRPKNTKYLEYLHRAGPEALGSKTIPEGADDCLKGKTFVITGVLPSFEREEIANAVIKYGGKVTQSVSKNTSYMVVGRDAGPSKLEKAEKLGTKQLNEDEFLDLIASTKKSSVPKQQRKTPVKIEDISSTETKNYKKSKTPEKKSNEVIRTIVADVKKVPSLEKKDAISRQSNNEELMWVDKYKPTSIKQIIGQQGDRSNVKKLLHWLVNWQKNNNGEKKKRPPPGKWNDDGSAFKAALLSGPPGVGKTTSATLVCKEAGFSFVELNASDTRSKKSLQTEVQELLTNRSLSTSFGKKESLVDKHCLIMDEVDGMAGNEDRGGIQELIQLIKTSRIPIICLCNDRNHQKIRSLVNYCFDLRFQRPRVEQLKGAMMSICCKENLKIPPQALQELIISTNQDVRQILHHLSIFNSNPGDLTEQPQDAKKKDTKLSPFDALKKVFSAEDHKTMSIHDKSDLFFYDYSIAPLFVQENYVHVKPQAAQGNLKKHLELLSQAADSICDGDLVDKIIRTQSQWGLLPVEAVYASVIPGEFMKGYLQQMITFPSWLGQNSKRGKIDRLVQELQSHMRLKISGSKSDVNIDYSPHIKNSIIHPLESKELEGVPDAVAVMEAYDLLREDLDSLLEISQWSNKPIDPFSKINSKVKAAFTRMYNSDGHLIPYAIVTAPKKRSRGNANFDDTEEMEEAEEEENKDEEEEMSADAMIKVKKPRTSKNSSVSNTPGPSRGRGRGKRK